MIYGILRILFVINYLHCLTCSVSELVFPCDCVRLLSEIEVLADEFSLSEDELLIERDLYSLRLSFYLTESHKQENIEYQTQYLSMIIGYVKDLKLKQSIINKAVNYSALNSKYKKDIFIKATELKEKLEREKQKIRSLEQTLYSLIKKEELSNYK